MFISGTRLVLGILACENRELICFYFPFIGGMAETFDRVKATDDYKRLNNHGTNRILKLK